jgi:hypothetical protein
LRFRRGSCPGTALARAGRGEVDLGLAAAEAARLDVVRPGGVLGGVEGAEPYAGALVRVADLRRPLAPWALTDAAEVAAAALLLARRPRGAPVVVGYTRVPCLKITLPVHVHVSIKNAREH